MPPELFDEPERQQMLRAIRIWLDGVELHRPFEEPSSENLRDATAAVILEE